MDGVSAKNNFAVYAGTKRDEMLGYIPPTAEVILDVGCSDGQFGADLKNERDVTIWGVEADASAAEQASRRLDRVICDKFNEAVDIPKNYFDCIVFNDVLEHMVDPYSALKSAKELLKPQGKIVASIPNVRYFDNIRLLLVHQSWEYTDDGILDRTHLRFFTKRSIESTFSGLGYQIEQIEGINPLEKCHPPLRNKFKILNMMTFNRISDMRWRQFAIVASVAM